MRAETLRTYFESESQQRRALDAYFDAWKGRWPVHEMLELYKASQFAFNSLSTANGAFQHFEKIYDELTGYWQVFRPYNRAECWPPPQIFETIKREFPEFSWRGHVNLLNFLKGGTRLRLESCLAKMQGIKPHKGYPVMAASKFLHFYNPGLFPIYDYEVIWKKVFCRFRKDFRVPAAPKGGSSKKERPEIALVPYFARAVSTDASAPAPWVAIRGKDSVDLDWLRDEIRQVEEVTQAIVRQMQTLEVEIPGPPRVQLMQEATVQ